MLTEVSDTICERLRTIAGIRQVGEWAGEVEDLLGTAQALPSLHVIYAGAKYADGPAAIGTAIAPHQMVWTVVLLSNNLRSRGDGALAAYAFIEAVREKLIKFPVPGGWLWPAREGLITTKGGVLGYGLDYRVAARTGA